jgi:pimeloyl-ACP methyl ester carboxylesterase
MIGRFLAIALLLSARRSVTRNRLCHPVFKQKPFIPRKQRTSSCGGKGPVVVPIHGYAENSDSWAPLAADLMKDHTVVVPELRGIGKSSKPEAGYDMKTQAKDIRAS